MKTFVNDLGYEALTKNDRRGNGIKFHTLIAERFFGGPLPENNVVHHIDENKLNNHPSNLMICSRNHHHTVHRQIKAKKESGHSDWRKCWICKKYDDPKNLFIPRRNAAYHGQCERAYQLDRRKNNENVRKKAKERGLLYWRKNGEKLNKVIMDRRKKDKAYREKLNSCGRAYYARKKEREQLL